MPCEPAVLTPQRAYQQQTYELYEKRFSVQVVTVVQEFKALGIDVSIENCAAVGVCSPIPISVELHALAASRGEHPMSRCLDEVLFTRRGNLGQPAFTWFHLSGYEALSNERE